MPHKDKKAAADYKRKWREQNPDVEKAILRRKYLKYRKKYIEIGKKNYSKNKRKVKDYALRQKYGISIEEYEQMLATQGGRCAICGESSKRLVVDHCHETGSVRSLLCNRCNLSLGAFEDNVDILMSAIEYLNRHAEVNR